MKRKFRPTELATVKRYFTNHDGYIKALRLRGKPHRRNLVKELVFSNELKKNFYSDENPKNFYSQHAWKT